MVPVAPSARYRRAGGRPVLYLGRVVWLTPDQHAALRRSASSSQIPDAANSDIVAYDRQYEQAAREDAAERPMLLRLFRGDAR